MAKIAFYLRPIMLGNVALCFAQIALGHSLERLDGNAPFKLIGFVSRHGDAVEVDSGRLTYQLRAPLAMLENPGLSLATPLQQQEIKVKPEQLIGSRPTDEAKKALGAK
jgi:hypothetical protein